MNVIVSAKLKVLIDHEKVKNPPWLDKPQASNRAGFTTMMHTHLLENLNEHSM